MRSSPTRRAIRIATLLLATLGLGAVVVTGGLAVADATNSEAAAPDSPLLDEVAEQIALPEHTWTASGTHTAKGFTTEAAETTGVEGMKADCENINLNKKLASDFRSDVFGEGVKGFFYKCLRVSPDTNEYWFTVSSADKDQIDKLCDPATEYPVVHDEQHDTYWVDEPFMCTSRVSP